MKYFEDYYTTNLSLQDDIASLATIDRDSDDEVINDLVMNFVLKYLLKYLNLKITDPEEMGFIVEDHLTEKYKGEDTACIKMDSDSYPVKCLVDIRSSSALVKEIIFGGTQNKDKDSFFGIDFGSGTGILAVAMHIHAQRQKIKKIICIGVDHNPPSVERSQEVVSELFGEDLTIHQGDLTKDDIYEELKLSKHPIDMIATETINVCTSQIQVGRYGAISSYEDVIEEIIDKTVTPTLDPYTLILDKLIDHIPEFYNKVMNGDIELFPDVINSHYDPQRGIQLFTAGKADKKIPLERIGEIDFGEYEKFGAIERW